MHLSPWVWQLAIVGQLAAVWYFRRTKLVSAAATLLVSFATAIRVRAGGGSPVKTDRRVFWSMCGVLATINILLVLLMSQTMALAYLVITCIVITLGLGHIAERQGKKNWMLGGLDLIILALTWHTLLFILLVLAVAGLMWCALELIPRRRTKPENQNS